MECVWVCVYPTPVTKGSAHSQPPATDATAAAADEAQAFMGGHPRKQRLVKQWNQQKMLAKSWLKARWGGPLGAWLRSDDLIKSREKEGERERAKAKSKARVAASC